MLGFPQLSPEDEPSGAPQVYHENFRSQNVHFTESDDGLGSVRPYPSSKLENVSRSVDKGAVEIETEAEPSAGSFPHSSGRPPVAVQNLLPVTNPDSLAAIDNSKVPSNQTLLHRGSSIPVSPDSPAWKSLISGPLPPSDVIFLIGMIFSSRDEIRTVCNLRGDDAQTFIDVIHEVCIVFLPPRGTI